MFIFLSLPLLWLGGAIAREVANPGSALGADPGEAVVLHLGEWTLRVLLITLAVSSLRRLAGVAWLIRSRRMIGLWGYSYLCLHLLSYLGLLSEFDWRLVLEDLVERTYITAGMLALLLLTPLAVTSTNGWRRRLGSNWQRLHRLIYPAVALGLVHLAWLTKDGYGEVVLYGVLFGLLMFERIYHGRARPSRTEEHAL
ncbi:MAG: sulfoxide reductase heme-binding subunit YedZ [Gammaproteobacteria bacterium]|nr:sulfoxide reductase heme-binding subunit YedZ [Gammaproteobacteria bacterium]